MVDRELLQRYAGQRDAEAFAELVRGYQGLVYATCRRGLHCQDDLDDAVQETFLRLARKAGEIRSNLGAWLHRCAVNVALDLNRRRHARQRHEMAVGVAADAVGPEQREMAELREQVDVALAKLEEEQRELIIQRYLVGRAMAELAREEGVTPSAMTYRLEKAVGALRAELEAMGCAGVGAVVALMEGEGQVQVPAGLRGNVMKIGLKGVGAAGVGGMIGGKVGLAAAGVLVAGGVWVVAQMAAGPTKTSAAPAPASRPAGPMAMVEQGPAAAAPKWDAAAPGATPAVLSGRVVDEAGKPVAGASVRLSGPGAYPTTTTDRDGRYAFATVGQDGEYEIEVGAKGYVRTGRWGPRQEEPVKLRLSKTAEARRDVVLERGTAVVVNVLDGKGNPIPKAKVAIASEEPAIHQFRDELYAQQDTDGNGMVAQTMPSGKRYIVAAVAGGMAGSHQTVMLEKGSDVVEVEFVLTAGYEVRGVVMCSDGKPAAGYEVALNPTWWNAGHCPSWGQVRLSEKGEFVLPVSEGEYNVYLWDNQMGRPIGKIRVPTQEKVVRLNAPMVSKSSLVSIRGQVRVNGKRPALNIIAYASTPDQRETRYATVEFGPGDPQIGHYEIKGLAPGEYVVWFSPLEVKAGKREPVKAPGEAPLVELTVQGKTRLSGQVVDAATGKPLTQFAVRLAWQDPAWTQVAHGEGRFSLDLRKPGEYQVQVSAAGYARAWTEGVRVADGEDGQVTVKMVPGGALTGRVVDNAGKPMAGAKVMAYSTARGERVRSRRRNVEVEAVTTNERGEFAWPHLPAGATQVEVAHPEFVPHVSNATVVDGQSADVGTITLITGGTIEGAIYDGSGQAVAGATVMIEDDADPGIRVELRTDADGRYRMAHRPERRETVRVIWPDMANLQRAVRPQDGRTVQMDFSLDPRVVSGRVLDGDVAMAKRWVRLSGRQWRGGHVDMMIATDEKGNFVFHGIPQGQYVFSSDPEVWRVVDVPADKAVDLGDIKADYATVQLTIDAEDAADVKGLTEVGAVNPETGHSPIREAGGGWQGVTAATEFRVRATYKIEDASLTYSIPCRRTAGQKVVKEAMHLPQRSATLDIGKREDSGAWAASAWLESEDGSIFVSVSLESKQGKVLRLPPGKYYVRDIGTDKRNPRVAPIVLEEGKTTEVSASSVVTPRSVMVCVDVWTDQGIVAEVQPRMYDADGKELERDERWLARWAWNLQPGKYQTKVESDGKVLTRDVVVTPELMASERPMQAVDVFLPEHQ